MTRKEYLDGYQTGVALGVDPREYAAQVHREYYGQFVHAGTIAVVVQRFTLKRLKEALAEDRHLNTIPLREWDFLGSPLGVNAKMRAVGDYLTVAGSTCVWKEAARQAVEGAD
jgi:hypothetical protein